MRRLALIAIPLAVAALAGCGGGGSQPPPGELQRLGGPEGRLNLVALPGYVEDGTTQPELDWVSPFERASGCEVSRTVAASPGQVTRLMRTRKYDGVSARGDVSGGLVSARLVAPVNTDLVPAYSQLFPALRHLPSNTVDGVTYGLPTGRLATFLTWRTDLVRVPHDEVASSELIFDPEVASRYRGGVTAYDNPMYVADAALYLREHEQGLGIDDVYELDRDQLDAVVRLLMAQRENVGRYWRNSSQNVRQFSDGTSIVGPAWRTSIDRILRNHVKLRADVPDEGATGQSDSWMIALHAPHPNCMYRWMNYISGPRANAQLAERTGQAPANERACDLTRDPAFCDTYRAADEDLFRKVRFWTTPLADCGDDRGETCTSYADWARAWAQVAGR
jgi:putative spermidine/putrescine transport system substrate-binding protein